MIFMQKVDLPSREQEKKKKKKNENEEKVKLADLGQIVASDYEETAATQRPNLSSNEVWIGKMKRISLSDYNKMIIAVVTFVIL